MQLNYYLAKQIQQKKLSVLLQVLQYRLQTVLTTNIVWIQVEKKKQETLNSY